MLNYVLVGLIFLLATFLTLAKQKKTYKEIIKLVIEKTAYRTYLKFITAQAQLESNYGQSRLAKECNNLFGMKIPYIRQSFRIQDPNGVCGVYSKFASLEDSVRDYVLYLDYVKMPKTFYTIDQFGTFLKNKGYFTDPDYLSKLKKIYLKL
jgi:flagellum-specific peptidoglycan hydrolase FlgJ